MAAGVGGAGRWTVQVRWRNAKGRNDKAAREHEAERVRLAQLELAHEQLIDDYAAVEAALSGANKSRRDVATSPGGMWRVPPPRCGRAEVRRLNVARSIVECLLSHGSALQASACAHVAGAETMLAVEAAAQLDYEAMALPAMPAVQLAHAAERVEQTELCARAAAEAAQVRAVDASRHICLCICIYM
jgi:hypothetical protein